VAKLLKLMSIVLLAVIFTAVAVRPLEARCSCQTGKGRAKAKRRANARQKAESAAKAEKAVKWVKAMKRPAPPADASHP
jgi:hypothetical protein